MLKFGILCLVLLMLGNTYLHLHLREFHFNKDFQDQYCQQNIQSLNLWLSKIFNFPKTYILLRWKRANFSCELCRLYKLDLKN